MELEEAKRQLNICAQLNVSEVQAKTVARFAVLVDDSLLGKFCSSIYIPMNCVAVYGLFLFKPHYVNHTNHLLQMVLHLETSLVEMTPV